MQSDQAHIEEQRDSPPLWVQPNRRTIEFSDQKRAKLLKQYAFMDQAKLDSIGHEFQNDIVEATKASPETSSIHTSISAENAEFLRRMASFVNKLGEWSARDPVTRMSKLDALKIDLLYATDFQNVLCEYLSHYVTVMKRLTHQGELMPEDGGSDGPYAFDNVMMVLRALRYVVSQATNTAFFGALQIILQLTSKSANFRQMSLDSRRRSIAISEELAVTLELLFQRIGSQKNVFQMICTQQEKWDTVFKKISSDYQDHCAEVIRDFSAITQLMLFKGGEGAPAHHKLLREQEGCELESRLAKVRKECSLLVSDSLEDIRECFVLHAYTMNLLMGQYFDLVKQQKVLFQKHIDPAKVVKNLIEIVSSNDPYFSPKVRVSSLKVLKFMSDLDTHPEFRYDSIHDNPYFTALTNYFQEYVTMAKGFAEALSSGSTDQNDSSTKMVVDTGPSGKESSVYNSQQFLKAFLSFLFALIAMKTRSMQAQLFPQLVDPLVRLITVMPRDNTYIINLDCQKTALSVLKEIIKNGVSFDDPRQLVLLIERLKVELRILREDFEGTSAWVPFNSDDADLNSHSMVKRQELIGSCLRFLCVSIVKMDPNAISINQNFVAHSRKILESNIFEDCLKELVFQNNRHGGDEAKLEQVIDPIFFSCVQLYTYVFNDLHQKIGEAIENGLLTCILDSLTRRLPIQQGVIVVSLKFMRLLCLHQQGHRKLVDSNAVQKVLILTQDHRVYSEYQAFQKSQDQLGLFTQLANESQELSDQMIRANVDNLKTMIDVSWKLTEEYLENERVMKEEMMSQQTKDLRKEEYYKRQTEFEKSVENVCYAFLFLVHDQLDVFGGNSQSNVLRSLLKQEDLDDVLRRVLTTPTICSAASNFLVAFGDMVTVIFTLKGKAVFENHMNWLAELLRGQIASLKVLLKVDRLDKYDPTTIKDLQPIELPAIAEQNPEKLDLLFKRYQMSAEDLLWVSIAKVHAYLDLLLIAETISRSFKRDEMQKVCVDFYLRPEVGRTQDSLRTQVIWLEELLKKFKFQKYLDKMKNKLLQKSDLIQRFKNRLEKVEWKSYAMILEPQNDYEEALNLYYVYDFARADSFRLEDKSELTSKIRVVLQPSEEEVPELTPCKKKCVFFTNRISTIYRRERPFMLGTANSDLSEYSRTNSVIYFELISVIVEKCKSHLIKVKNFTASERIIDGVDLEIVEIRLQLDILHDLGQLLLSKNKIAKSASMAMFMVYLLELGLVKHLFTVIDWASQVLLAYDEVDHPCSKILLHQQVLHDCLLTPMQILSYLISGEFLKRDQLKYYLSPNELNFAVALAKLKLTMMKELVQPMIETFLQPGTQDQFLRIADQYDKDFSTLIEGIYGVLSANAFFGSGSAFDPEYIKPIQAMFEGVANDQQKSLTDPLSRQLMDMGFEKTDVRVALMMNGGDFEAALNYLLHLTNHRESSGQQQQPSAEESKQSEQAPTTTTTTIQTTQPAAKPSKKDSQAGKNIADTSGPVVTVGDGQDPLSGTTQVGDAKEILAANEHEFTQRRIETIKIVADSLIRVLPSRLINVTLIDRERIFQSFLSQIRKESDAKVKKAIVEAIHGIINTLINKIQLQNQDMAGEDKADYDWLLLDTIKLCMASDQITLPPEFSFASIAEIIATQLNRKITKLATLTAYEKPSTKDLPESEARKIEAQFKEKSLEIHLILFNTQHLVRTIINVCEEIRNGLRLQSLREMVTDASKQAKPPVLNDLSRILTDLEVKFKGSDSQYFTALQGDDTQMQIDTSKSQATSLKTKQSFAVDQERAASHLQAYFSCLHMFFKEMGSVSGFFHQEFGFLLGPIVYKSIKCLNLMAQIGQVGQFDFAKSFMQKNLLRLMLQAKVIDKDFQIEIDVWRPQIKQAELGKIDYFGGRQLLECVGQFRALIKEVSTQKKDQVKHFEIGIKQQLYGQFRQNFKKSENIDLHDHLQALYNQSSGGKGRKDDSPSHGLLSTPLSGAHQQPRHKTKGKELISGTKDSVFTRPTRPSNRSKSQEKNSQNQQGSKNRSATQIGRDQLVVSNKVLKKLLVKHDDCNLSKLEDFIAFNKQKLGDQFFIQNQSFLQACARVCVIKEVEVDPKNGKNGDKVQARSANKVQVTIHDKKVTSMKDARDILSTVYGEIDALLESEDSLIAVFKKAECVDKALKMKKTTMALRGQVHTVEFKEVVDKKLDTETVQDKKEPVKQLHIMLKRQVLKEIISDTDFNQGQNFQFVGHSVNKDSINSVHQVTKTQQDLVNTLLEAIVEQTKGLKMDILKIIRNPQAFIQTEKDEPGFVVGETVLKLTNTVAEESKTATSADAQSKKQEQFAIDTENSKSVSKQYYVDYAGILNALVCLLEQHPGTLESVVKHNEGKTLKFIIRNIFYLISVFVDGKNGKQVTLNTLKNMQSYNAQKLPDRLSIVISFLTRVSVCRAHASLKTQVLVQDVQKSLVGIMAKGLIRQQRQQKEQQPKQVESEQLAKVCARLAESTRLVSQYNTVWLLTQFLFYKPKQLSMNKPIEAIINNAMKLIEAMKQHIVKLFLVEVQLLHQKNGGNAPIDLNGQLAAAVGKNASSLSFLSHIKQLLDNLEESSFLFGKVKVPCMHMCIWAVTSVLKIFEHKPELFIQIRGPPPPPSDSDFDDDEQSASRREENKFCDHDHEMRSDGGGGAGPAGHDSDNDYGDDVDSDEDDADEEGEEDMEEEDSYGSIADLEGNEDLSSNRDNQSMGGLPGENDMQDELDDDGFDLDDDSDLNSYGSSDYDDEDDSAVIEIIPQIGNQNITSTKGGGAGPSNNGGDGFEIILGGDNNEPNNGPQGDNDDAISEGRVSAADGAPNADNSGVPGAADDESYYSGEEQDSYEPPMSYDNESASALSFGSNGDRDFGDGAGAHGDIAMDQFDDFDNMDNSGYSYSDDETDTINHMHHHHHHHHHAHVGSHNMFPASLSHLPLNQQMWRQITLVEMDQLESILITQTTSLNEVLDSVATSIWPFKTFVTGIAAGAPAETPSSAAAPHQGQLKSSSSGGVLLRDEQGDEIVTIDPDKFRDKTTIEEPAAKATAPQQVPQQKSTLDIEGMDPLFLESLGPQGLQNIADSHQIQNTVVNSANRISRDPNNLQQAQSRYENIMQVVREHPRGVQSDLLNQVQQRLTSRQLPQNVNSSNVDQVINVIQQAVGPEPANSMVDNSQNRDQSQQQETGRTRFMSVDTVAISMLGPNDQSRQIQAPGNRDEAGLEDSQNEQNLRGEAAEKTKVHIRGTQFMQNSFLDISDLIVRLLKNQSVTQVDRQCTEIIKQHLLPQESDSIEEKYTKTHDCMQMALVGFKIFEKNDLQIQSRIRLLFLIPSLRTTLIFRVLKLLNTEVANLVKHRDDCLSKNQFSPYKSAEQMPFIVDRDGQMTLQEMPLDQMISVTLTIVEQLQDCLKILGLEKAAQQQSAEISKVINSDPSLAAFARLSNLDPRQLNQSIIQSILSSLEVYFRTVKSDPWVLPLDQSQPQFKTTLVNQVLASLRKIILPLSKTSQLALPISEICKLIVAPGFLKLNKQGHQLVRKILNDINDKENIKQIGDYLEGRLEASMKSIIELLSAKRASLGADQKDNADVVNLNSNERFQGLLEETKELLKLSGGITKIKSENICRQETLAQLFQVSNAILQREQTKAESESAGALVKQVVDGTFTSSYAFMYRNDIKEMILILFALCEYNLRIVFSQPQISPSTAEATTTLTQSQEKKEKQPEETKGPVLIETNQLRRQQSSTQDQEMAEDDSQNEVLKAIESQIAAQWLANSSTNNSALAESTTQHKFQLDRRLRSIIGFFITNKKLINIFIRVNQQVVNVQLKNLVIKIPQILEFDTKRLIWRIMLKKQKQKIKNGKWNIRIRRDQAFEDSFVLMRGAKTDEWKMPLMILFQDEAGVDEGGLTKEWFTLLSKQMFNEDMALFLKSSTGSTYFPNPKSTVQVDHLDLFEFIGKFVGKALVEHQLLECYFVKAFYKIILEMPLDYADLEDYDQALHKSLTWILENQGAEHLCTYFVETQDYFGESKDTPLCEGGAEKLVTDDNKEEYVKLVANYRLKQAVKSQIDAFMKGLFMVVPRDLIKIFDNRELELLISGLQVVDIDDLRENTVYEGGYSASSKTILLFWEALREFDNSERAEFIQFVTGSSKVPVEGFKGLRGQSGVQKFTIIMVHSTDQNRLPQSHTCINQLDLPQYRDKETMKLMLLTASKEGKTFAIA